jgi:hypothetical protein
LISLERWALTDNITYLDDTPTYRYFYFLPPWADFVSAAGGVGAVDMPEVIRGAQLAYLTQVKYPTPTQPLPSSMQMPRLTDQTVVIQGLPLIVARGVFKVESKSLVSVNFGSDISLPSTLQPNVRIPVDDAGNMLVNFVGSVGSYQHVSAIDVIHGDVDTSRIAGKTMVVGVTDPTAAADASLLTPYSSMPRAEITANAIGSILDRSYITRSSREALVVLILLAVLLGMMLPVFRRLEEGAMAITISLTYIVSAVIVLTAFNHAFPVIAPVLLILFGTVIDLLLRPTNLYVTEEIRPARAA